MNCYKCGAPFPQLPVGGKIDFRASCDKCLTDLHCCKNCRFYAPGKPNDCLVPGTEFVADREKNNLCEEFSLRPEIKKNPCNNSCNNFGNKDDPIKRFNNLFKDD